MQNIRIKLSRALKQIFAQLYRNKSLVLSLSVIVTVVTVYSLILPAVTLEKDEAAKQGGIDVPGTEEVVETSEEEPEVDVIKEEAKPTAEKPEVKEDVPEKTEDPAPEEADKPKEDKKEDTVEPAVEEKQLITKETELTKEGKDYSVSVVVDKKAEVPADTELAVSEIKKDGTTVEAESNKKTLTAEESGLDYNELYKEAEKALKKTDKDIDIDSIRFYDISLLSGEDSVEPSSDVDVKITLDSLAKDNDGSKYRIVHFGENGPEVLDSETKDDEINFKTDGFSVYAVVEPYDGPEARATVNFYGKDLNTPVATVYVKNSDQVLGDGVRQDNVSYLEDIVSDPAIGRLESDELFRGWSPDAIMDADGNRYDEESGYVGSEYTASTTKMDIQQIREYLAGLEIHEGDIVNIYAMIFKYYTVTYYSDDINGDPNWAVTLGADTVLYRENQTSVPYTVNMAYSATANQNFKGWIPTATAVPKDSISQENHIPALDIPATKNNISPGGTQPDNVYANGTGVTLTGDVVFNVDAPRGNWLIYNANGKGATFNAPQFYLPTETTSPAVNAVPDNMKRNGYEFGGWYYASGFDSNGEPLKDENGNVILGDQFVFGGRLTENTNIYAKWTPVTTAPYTIVFWTQNGDRSGYDVAGSYVGSGTVGQAIPLTFRDNTDEDYLINVGNNGHYTGFCLNHTGTNALGNLRKPRRDEDGNYIPDENGIPQMEVATIPNVTPEGDAVLNVYYDRIVYNLKFYLYRQEAGPNGNYNANGQRSYATRSNNGANVWNIATGWTGVGANNVPGISSTRFTVARDETAQYGNITNNSGGRYYGFYFTLSAYYGENIEAKWPTYDEIKGPDNDGTKAVSFVMMNGTGLKGNSYTGNGYGDGRDTIKGVITVMDDGILGQTQDANGNYLIIRYASYNDWTYHIYYECIPGQTYENTVTKTINGVTKTYYYDHDVQSRSSNTYPAQQNPPAYEGFKVATTNGTDEYYDGYGGNAPSQGNITGYTVYLNYYYNREMFNITYMDGVYVDGNNNIIQTRAAELLETNDENIVNGAVIPDEYKNYVPNLPAGEVGYVFEGWYLDEGCTVPYTFTTMPIGGIVVHAKWRKVQYRVFLHPDAMVEQKQDPDDPNSPTIMVRDLSLSWGDESASAQDKQQMNFRVSWGDKISLPFGTRKGYEFIGWFTEDDKLYMAGTELNDTTIPREPVYNKETDFTDTMDKFGLIVNNGETYWVSNEEKECTSDPFNSDLRRSWITRKLDLYGKWRKVIEGSDGIKVTYDVGEYGKTGTAPEDPLLYKDNTGAVAQAACEVDDQYANKYQFLHWVVQKWVPNIVVIGQDDDGNDITEDQGEYVDTDITVYPGDNFTAKLDYAKAVIYESHENPNTHETVIDKADYTMRLKAEYTLNNIAKPTHIDWYLNTGEVDTFVSPDHRDRQDGLQINEAVNIWNGDDPDSSIPTREGYKFLGWARVPTGTSESVYNENVNQTKGKVLGDAANPYLYLTYHEEEGGYYTAIVQVEDPETHEMVDAVKRVKKVAADEIKPYHDMYAVWDPIKYKVTVEKVVVSSVPSDLTTTAFGFTASSLTPASFELVNGGSQEYTEIPYDTPVSITEIVNLDDFEVSAIKTETSDVNGNPYEQSEYPQHQSSINVTGESGDVFNVKSDILITVTNTRKQMPIKLVKIDQSDLPLAGATFNITDGGDLNVTATSTLNAEETEALIYESNLSLGTYTVTETVTPPGYNPIVGDIVIKVESSTTGPTLTVTMGGKAYDTSLIEVDPDTQLRTIKIRNSAGVELPEAGGPGTTAFYIYGLMLILGSYIALVVKKRME